jgi:FtsZ-binding cell division protein ZapB
VNDSKLQAALDELERLHDTVKEFKTRNGRLPNPDSDAGRAVSALEAFAGELKRLRIGQLVYARS